MSQRKSGSIDWRGILSNRIVLGIASALVVLLLIGGIDTFANWGKIYPGVHIGEIDVSGMTFSDAYDAVQKDYESRLGSTEIKIYGDEATYQKDLRGETIEDLTESEYVSAEEAAASKRLWVVTASDLQARLDTTAMVSSALEVGRENGGILTRMSAQTLGYDIEPVLNLNASAVENIAEEIDLAIGNPHEDYDVVVDYGEAYIVEGHDGEEVDRSWLSDQIKTLLLERGGEDYLIAETQPAEMRIGPIEAQQAADSINASIASGATFAFNGTFWNATTAELGDLIATEKVQDGDGWKLRPYYLESATKSAILRNLQSNFTTQNINVEFIKDDDSVFVRTNATGSMPEVGNAVHELTAATIDTVPHDTPLIEVESTQMPPTMSIQAAMDYGIISTISSYETEYTGGATARNNNIHLAADLLNNSIVKANGGEWSFNETAGECNEEKGFKGAGSIVNGETVDEIGGGICQVATTVFNAVFEAGFPVDERSNHSLYIASYPAGRDAAISWPDLDLRWHNDTPNDVLVQTEWTDTTITVTLLGVDPGYEVSSETGEFKKGAEYNTITEYDSSLSKGETQIKQYGEDGSTIKVKRLVKDSTGKILSRDVFESVYDARDEIILTGSSS